MTYKTNIQQKIEDVVTNGLGYNYEKPIWSILNQENSKKALHAELGKMQLKIIEIPSSSLIDKVHEYIKNAYDIELFNHKQEHNDLMDKVRQVKKDALNYLNVLTN